MMNDIKTYYLPIDTTNIGKLFSLGCICPSEYFDGWNQDPQSLAIRKQSILLCAEKYTDITSCCLEIVFTEEEKSNVKKIADDFYTFHKPLPISRIKMIFFQNNEKRLTTVYDIEKGDAFIPDRLIKIDSSNKVINTAQLHSVFDYGRDNKDWNEQIDLFKRIVGGFALMRLGGDEYRDYSKNYFETFSKINKVIENELSLSDHEFNDHLSKFIDNTDSTKDSIIYNPVNSDLGSKLLSDQNIRIHKKGGSVIIDNTADEKVYIATVLASYGNDRGKRKKIDDFIADLSIGKFRNEFIEELCLVFGINQGYDAFRNKYEFDKKQFDVKYKLDSQIDYYTIESAYQYVFNNRISESKFKYLDNWCPRYSGSIVNKMKYATYRILDKDIIYKKKAAIGSQDYIRKLLQNLQEVRVYEEIVDCIESWLSPILRIGNKEDANSYFMKKLKSSIQDFSEKVAHHVKEGLDKNYNIEITKLKNEHEDLIQQKIQLSNELQKRSNSSVNKPSNEYSNNDSLRIEYMNEEKLNEIFTLKGLRILCEMNDLTCKNVKKDDLVKMLADKFQESRNCHELN